ncbi:zinc metalloprotease [Mycena olivaceomarginata]|nr:zinc metalloprotease [Mycena olivaceomarginata]
MHLYLSFLALVVTFFLAWIDPVAAHSVSPSPLKRLANPSTLALEILPRRQLSSSASSTPFGKREPFLPRSTTLRYDDSFRLKIAAFDETFYLHLRPNDHLIHPAARIKYYSTRPDGTTRTGAKSSMPTTPSRVCARTPPASCPPRTPATLGWARIMVHHQGDIDQRIAPVFEGAFTVEGVVYHIATKDNYLRHKRPLDAEAEEPVDIVDSALVIWRESDMMTPEEEHFAHTGEHATLAPVPQTCGHDRMSYNTDPAQNPILQKPATNPWFENPMNLFGNMSAKRDDVVGTQMGTNFVNNIGDNAGCPNTQKVLYMGVAADCVYTQKYGSHSNATSQILNNWNTASSLYKSTFNVSLGIVELQIQDEVCPTPVNTTMPTVTLNDRLSLFSAWRGAKGSDGVGLWHLMSGCPTGSEVGIAWLATLCQQTASGSEPSVVSGTAVSTAGLTEWQVVAHEIGHNFGAIHDCADGCNSTSACCPLTASSCNANAQYIMSPVAQKGEKLFSPCSLGNICSLMTGVSRTNTTCLQDPSNSVETISLQMCGNGIVEQGEQCDPGEDVDSPCCDAKTCKFKPNALCDPDSSPCCTPQCGFAPTTQVCRPSKDAKCDMPEMCTGASSACPADVVVPNGKSCGASGLACASGQCTSVALQCQQLGSSMNLTRACPNQSSNTCQRFLVDGSPCGYGGICASGGCQSNGLLSTAKAWFTQNLQIAIPVAIVAGLVALLLIWVIGGGACFVLVSSMDRWPFIGTETFFSAILALLRCCRGRPNYAGYPAPSMPPPGPDMRHQRLGSYEQPAASGPMGIGAGPAPPPPVRFDSRPPPQPNYSGQQQQSGWVDPGRYNGGR